MALIKDGRRGFSQDFKPLDEAICDFLEIRDFVKMIETDLKSFLLQTGGKFG
jgi:hypothetical protein